MRAYPSQRLSRPYQPNAGRGKKPRERRVAARLRRLLVFGIVGLVGLTWAAVLPLRWIDPPTTAFMLQDRSNRPGMKWVDWDQIGDALPTAVVASEDQKFPNHFGFDTKSIRDSVEEYADGGSLRGASTISQQVAKNLYLWPGRSFLRKAMEAYFTVLLELGLPKQRILEIYLNVAEFGPGIYGVGLASDVYFDRPPIALSDSDAALLAAVLPSPKRLHVANPSAYVRERQNWILDQMQRLRREQWMTALKQRD